MQGAGGISSFSGGIADDIREPQTNKFGITKHFDIFNNPYRLTPYRSTESEADATSAAHLGAFDLRHFQLGKNGLMYALGNDGSAHPQVYQKTDPTTGLWSASTTAAGANALIYGSFIEWAGAWWMFSGTAKVSKWTTGSTFTDTVATVGVSIVTTAQSVVGADDNMYMFYNNRVVRVSNAGAVTDNVLTNLPSDMRITSVARWGTYIAIGMAYGTSATAAPSGASKVFIWDMVTTSTINDVIDWGEGALLVLGNVEGRIVGVSNKYLETPSGLTSLSISQGSMVVRMWTGGTPQIMNEVVANQSVTLGRFIRDVVVKDNKMYWVASVPFGLSTSTESTYNLGIWAFGRKNVNSNFALTLDYVEEAVDTSNFKIVSFGNAGNYWFINHSAAGLVTKTDDAANFTFTSIYESTIFNYIIGLRNRHISDSSAVKKLMGVTLTFDPLPASATGVLKFRKDNDTAWTQIFTYTSTNALYHSAIGIENLTLGGDTATMTIASPAVVTLANHKLVAGQIVRFTTTGALPTGVQAGLDYYVISTGLTTSTFQFSATSGGSAINSSGSQSGTHTLDRTVPLPLYKEIQFRFESTGGAIITGFKFSFDHEDRDIY